ncbi:prenyltransferase/squalene oxidase repeat-containing protein [Micromonospora sp. CPCC 205539]|uniref:prenyltransferase/squalene oxidase repeat-containing protein n=1 Tax=Micromonospora sp. CPCC 205539 TaxID=3122408 RepID=UPI002FF345E7
MSVEIAARHLLDGPPAAHPVAAAERLVAEMLREPAGQVTASLYETGRLVSLSPWLTGHAERVRYLLDQQHSGGGWGPPEGYGLVPTLSATEALLTILRTSATTEALSQAAEAGLRTLTSWLSAGWAIPDTPAIDLIVPALIGSINDQLTGPDALPGLARWRNHRLPLPSGMDGRRLAAVRALMASGGPVPEKLLHALEVVADLVGDAVGVRPPPSGIVGASPAATAAWLGSAEPAPAEHPSRAYLESVVARHGGPVPCATPITVFERAWVIGTLTRAGITTPAPPDLVGPLTAGLGPHGIPAGPGLPPDADTTSVTLYALARLGLPADPTSLLRFETAEGFCTWPGEDGFSVTTNAHVLDALAQHLATRPDAAPHYHAAAQRLVVALQAHQLPDGSWQDRWHASPYYATMCCSLALAEFAAAAATESLDRAVAWTVSTQRDDGSWGRWEGTVEETAYAMQTLAIAGRGVPSATGALSRGYAYLTAASAGQPDGPALWHDKDLYHPTMIVNAAVFAAQHLAEQSGQRVGT